MVGECLVFEGSSIQAVLAQGGNESCYDAVVVVSQTGGGGHYHT